MPHRRAARGDIQGTLFHRFWVIRKTQFFNQNVLEINFEISQSNILTS